MRFTKNVLSANAVKNACALCVISMLLFAGVLMAKEFWETKPYNQWTQRECQKLLSDSPWVKELNLMGQVSGSGGAASLDSQAPFVKYNIQIRSAAPLRQAMVRQGQINRKYDSLSDDEKRAFDESMDSFLLGPPPEFVVFHITYETNNLDYIRDLNRHWETQNNDMLKNSVFLSAGKGEKVPVAQFIPGTGASQEFQFFFPREINGREIIGDRDKTLNLEFAYPVVGRIGDGRGFIEFRTDKMKVNNEVIY